MSRPPSPDNPEGASESPAPPGIATEQELWLQRATDDPIVSDQIAFSRTFPAREARYYAPKTAINPELLAALHRAGIRDLYTHQAFAYDESMAGNDIVVATGTSSGKSLCYHLPALQRILAEPAARALYIFPTKALAQDQAQKLEGLLPGPHVRVGVYDGDTPKSQRSAVRKLAHVVITNPDMLHIGILPGHESWTSFLKSVRLIVVDEMHAYKGVFGSHVAGVLRRLLRLCAWHHNHPQIVACSATVGNPDEAFRKLTGRQGRVIDVDGSPSGEKLIVFWNPPEKPDGSRMSANVVTAELMATLVQSGVRTLAFNRARVSAELVLRYAQKALEQPELVESYRAGYTPAARRKIEKAIFSGKLLGLSATSAMELGVDIGGLDAVLMNGWPGSISSFWQQAGRAGRGNRNGIAILVAHADPLEQFLLRHPLEVFERLPERVTLNPENPQILAQQLTCAAHERAVTPTEATEFGSNGLEVAEELDRAGILEFKAGRFFYPSHVAPAPQVNIRGTGGDTIRLMLKDVELGTMEQWRAMTSAHEGAIYLHRGASYRVSRLDLERKVAELEPFDGNYYTQSIVQSVITQNVSLRRAELGEFAVSLCGVTVTDIVNGYRLKALDGDATLGTELLELPPQSYDSLTVRFDFPEFSGEDLLAELGGLHGTEHGLIAVAPLLAGCDRVDLGSAWYSAFSDTLRPTIFVFDRAPGGVGLCEALFDQVPTWLQAAIELFDDCKCGTGCPSCLLSPRCEANNEMLNKSAAQELLGSLYNRLA